MNAMASLQHELRQLIREVIHEVLQELQAQDALQAKSAQHPHATLRRIERGALTERMVIAAVRDGITRLELGASVVITPLAKEKARAAKIQIERIG